MNTSFTASHAIAWRTSHMTLGHEKAWRKPSSATLTHDPGTRASDSNVAGIAAPLQPTLAVHTTTAAVASLSCSCLVTRAYQAIEIDCARARLSAAILHPHGHGTLGEHALTAPKLESAPAHVLSEVIGGSGLGSGGACGHVHGVTCGMRSRGCRQLAGMRWPLEACECMCVAAWVTRQQV